MTPCRPLFAFALVALTAGTVYASGINVAWNDCPAAGGTENMLFNCNVNTGNNVLVVSFVPPAGASDVIALDATLDLLNEPFPAICDPIPPGGPPCTLPTLPSYWDMQGPSGCRSTSASVQANFQTPPYDAGTCLDLWQGQGLAATTFTTNFNGTGQNQLRVATAVPTGTGLSVNAGAEYYAFRVTILHDKSTGTGACDGCCTPITLMISSLRLYYGSVGEYLQMDQPDIRNWATWNVGNTACITPTRNRTWGSVKALYR